MKSPPETAINSFSVVVLLSLIFGMAAFGTDMYLPAFPSIRRDFGVSPQGVQLSLSIFLYGNAIGHLLFGPLSDRYGRKPILLIGLTLFSTASFGCALASGIGEFLGYRLAQGMASASGPVLVRALVNDHLDRDSAAQMLALLTGLMAFAAMLTPSVGGWIAQHWSWQLIFYCIGATTLVLLVASLRVITESLPLERRLKRLGVLEIARGYCAIGRNLAFWSYVLPPALMFAGVFAYAVVNSFLLIDEIGMSEQLYGATYSFAACAYVAGSLAGRVLVRKVGVDRSILIGLTIGIIAAIMAFLASVNFQISFALILIPGLSMFFSTSLILPAASSVAVSLFPGRAGSASALTGFVQISFAGISSAIAAYLYDSTTMPLHAFTLASCTLAIFVWMAGSFARR
jgi:DHA1 family bicyclomycin/chloramphenicol resistance-like MFS transporter